LSTGFTRSALSGSHGVKAGGVYVDRIGVVAVVARGQFWTSIVLISDANGSVHARDNLCARGDRQLALQRRRGLTKPLNYTALVSIVLGVGRSLSGNQWEVTWMQAQRVFWIAGILFILLWLNRRRIIFNAFQIAIVCGLVLTVKAALQQYEWYSYLPHAFLHPAALQIQGTVLALFCVAWVSVRFVVKRALTTRNESWLTDSWRLLDSKFSVDRFIVWSLLGAFLLLAIYGALSGVTQELAALGSGYAGFNVAGFPHQEALASDHGLCSGF
jgi:hypothetical protein